MGWSYEVLVYGKYRLKEQAREVLAEGMKISTKDNFLGALQHWPQSQFRLSDKPGSKYEI